MRSQWRLVEAKNGIAFIEDMDGPVSVTNDAENVFSAIISLNPRAYGKNVTRVVYCDTEGEWWEIREVYTQHHPHTNISTKEIEFVPWHGMVWDTLAN